MLLPLEYVSWLLAWLQIRTCVLRYFDGELSKSADASIQMYLQRKRRGMGQIGPVECLRLLLFGSWIVIFAVADKRMGVKTSVDEL
ncbi:hypothetical protein V5799_024483 [Amblyomma americanum]|uniref:Uncharacterized protein n=1 Tax=Amblyomma americanum TaxID=6943 RepID=A0AAQ4ECE6_AMBAM